MSNSSPDSAERPAGSARLSRWRLLIALGGPGRLLAIVALAVITGLTEGVGLLMLVPILQTFGTGDGMFARYVPLGTWSLGALLAAFVGLVATRAVAAGLRQHEGARMTARVVDGLRARALAALVDAEWRHLATMSQAQNRALLITGVDRVWRLLDQGLSAIALVLNMAALAVAAFVLSWQAGLAVAVVGGTIVLLYGRLRRSARQLGEQLGEAYTAIHRRFEEILGALRLFKSFGREDQALGAAASAFGSLRRAEFAFVVQNAVSRAAVQIGGALLLAALVWLAIERWGASPLVILPFVVLCARALPQIQAMQEALQNFAYARPALDEVVGLIEAVEASAEAQPSGASPPRFEQALRLEQVGFAYHGGRGALAGIDLDLPARSSLALVGRSGSGKSTLADIIGGLLSPDSGRMLIDGVALDAAARRAWRTEVAYVQQEAVLFSGTVRDNLLWARPGASEAELAHALESAAAGFVFDLPGGLDCDLGEGGRQLSGGERQRIALARALLRRPRLLILDEATSAIDASAERAIAEAIGELRGTLTILIIGHRGLLTEVADRRVELRGGRIVAAEGERQFSAN